MMKSFPSHSPRPCPLASPAPARRLTVLAGLALCRKRARAGLPLEPFTGRRKLAGGGTIAPVYLQGGELALLYIMAIV